MNIARAVMRTDEHNTAPETAEENADPVTSPGAGAGGSEKS